MHSNEPVQHQSLAPLGCLEARASQRCLLDLARAECGLRTFSVFWNISGCQQEAWLSLSYLFCALTLKLSEYLHPCALPQAPAVHFCILSWCSCIQPQGTANSCTAAMQLPQGCRDQDLQVACFSPALLCSAELRSQGDEVVSLGEVHIHTRSLALEIHPH